MKTGLCVIKIIFTGNIAPEMQMSLSKFLCKVMILSCSNCDPRPKIRSQRDSKFNIPVDIHGDFFFKNIFLKKYNATFHDITRQAFLYYLNSNL